MGCVVDGLLRSICIAQVQALSSLTSPSATAFVQASTSCKPLSPCLFKHLRALASYYEYAWYISRQAMLNLLSICLMQVCLDSVQLTYAQHAHQQCVPPGGLWGSQEAGLCGCASLPSDSHGGLLVPGLCRCSQAQPACHPGRL